MRVHNQNVRFFESDIPLYIFVSCRFVVFWLFKCFRARVSDSRCLLQSPETTRVLPVEKSTLTDRLVSLGNRCKNWSEEQIEYRYPRGPW